MDESKQSDQHWSELADLLGLPPDKSGKPATKPASAEPVKRAEEPAPPAPVPEMEPAVAEPLRFEEETPRFERVPEEEPGWEAEFDAEEDEATMIVEDIGAVAETDESIEEVPTETPGDEEKPRRGRRRRRRGRRRGAERAEGEGRDRPAPERAEPRGQDRERSERSERCERCERSERSERGERGERDSDGRDRGSRRRHEPAPVAREEEFDTEEIDEPGEDAAAQNRPLSLEDTDFSNWNVPSWQDLISSLYRPDR